VVFWHHNGKTYHAEGQVESVPNLQSLDQVRASLDESGSFFTLIPFDCTENILVFQNQKLLECSISSSHVNPYKILNTSFIYQDWESNIACILSKIQNKELEKLVLCQQKKITLSQSIKPADLFYQLDHRLDCTGFAFEWAPNKGIAGVSPEHLFTLNGKKITCDIIAGTKKDKSSFSTKEYQEHDWVRYFLIEKLDKIACDIHLSEKHFVDLGYAVHIKQRVEANLLFPMSLSSLIKILHPTPAVCGYPQELAYSLIPTLEPTARGYFTGLVGYVTKHTAIFTVIIRSARIEENVLTLCAGAGIIKGSNANQEWEEIHQKMSLFMNLF